MTLCESLIFHHKKTLKNRRKYRITFTLVRQKIVNKVGRTRSNEISTPGYARGNNENIQLKNLLKKWVVLKEAY